MTQARMLANIGWCQIMLVYQSRLCPFWFWSTFWSKQRAYFVCPVAVLVEINSFVVSRPTMANFLLLVQQLSKFSVNGGKTPLVVVWLNFKMQGTFHLHNFSPSKPSGDRGAVHRHHRVIWQVAFCTCNAWLKRDHHSKLFHSISQPGIRWGERAEKECIISKRWVYHDGNYHVHPLSEKGLSK